LNTEVGKKIHQQYGLKEMEVTDEVFRSKHSVVFDQAETDCIRLKLLWFRRLEMFEQKALAIPLL